MKSKHLLPSSEISAYVERILVIEEDRLISTFTLPLYANGVPVILFQSVKGKIGAMQTGHLTLFGQTVLPELLSLNEKFILIAYFIKPYLLTPLFNVSALELTDKPTRLNLIHKKLSDELEERLINAADVDEMICLLNKYILDIIKRSKSTCSLIQYATTVLNADPSKKSLLNIQQQLHITERSFQRLFEKNLGVAPNLYRRICQFNSAFVQLNKNSNRKLTDIAYDNGYADQSHYIRSFKEFTSITPTGYLNFGSKE